MIQSETFLQVADNSGAKLVQCIKVLRSMKYASVGDVIVITIKECLPHRKVKKGDVKRAVVVRTTKEINRIDGTSIKFGDNAVVLLTDQGNPIGTQIRGPVAKELKNSAWTKVISLASAVL
uniref:Ribosomal protein L14 n=1 Tax=Jakoba libera TaxID=143017 RepID=M4Q9X0_JAKLI|nr:ribosomal protein L14 [Jakoba libera]AGH24207.1 ribosomal protein L14 [Jakoba libera]